MAYSCEYCETPEDLSERAAFLWLLKTQHLELVLERPEDENKRCAPMSHMDTSKAVRNNTSDPSALLQLFDTEDEHDVDIDADEQV